MCSVGDDYENDNAFKFVQRLQNISIRDLKCNKCKEARPIVLLRKKDIYCRNCFIQGSLHKFKALLGKHRLLRANDKVLVLFKSGFPSSALLKFLQIGLSAETFKRLKWSPIVLCIADFTKPQLIVEEYLRSVNDHIKHFDFPLYFIDYSFAYSNEDNIRDHLFEDINQFLDIKHENHLIIEHCNKSYEADFAKILERNLLCFVAKELGCKFAFTPELASDLASSLLTNISLGKGGHLTLDTGFCDNRDEEVTILRPLRLFDMKELALFCQYSHVYPVILKEELVEQASIQSLIETFVNNLQENYPATITTIVKTGDKLALHENSETIEKCTFCKAPFQNISHLTASEAIDFSHQVSVEQTDDSEEVSEDDFTDLCYSCRKYLNVLDV